MKYYIDLIKIIEGGIKGDTKKVYDYSLLLSEKLKNVGELDKSQRINKIIKNQTSSNDFEVSAATQGVSVNRKQIPFDQESKLELADIIQPSQISDKTIFMSVENEKQINEFVQSYLLADKLAVHGLDVATTLLLFGPPGCGKTVTALDVAKKLGLPIVVARLDTLISSFLGSTSKNIRLLFDYVSKTPCILFLDEFDAVAKLRDDQHELGELKRVVNSLLQNIDSLGDKSILIAATNHHNLLDEAIWRRFSTRINVTLPNMELMKDIVRNFVEEYNLKVDVKHIDFLSELFCGQSIADTEQIIKRGIRKAVLENRDVEVADLSESYFSYVQLGIDFSSDTDLIRRSKIKYLLDKLNNPSKRFLGELLRCHHNTISNDIDKIEAETVR